MFVHVPNKQFTTPQFCCLRFKFYIFFNKIPEFDLRTSVDCSLCVVKRELISRLLFLICYDDNLCFVTINDNLLNKKVILYFNYIVSHAT